MLKSFFDFGKADFFYSNLEEHLKKEFKKEFGISVIQTLYEEGNIENNIRLWVDFSDINNIQKSQLYNFVKSNAEGNSVDEKLIGESEEFSSEKIIDLFMHCMKKKITTKQKINIYIYDFSTEIKKYIYGNSLTIIRSRMTEIFDLNNIFVLEGPVIKIICKDLKQKSLCQNNYGLILETCYEIMKKFDNYNIFKEQDLKVEVLCETEIEPQKLNDYFMKK